MKICDKIRLVVGEGADELDADTSAALLKELSSRYAVPGLRPLWERLRSSVSLREDESWRLIVQVVSGPLLLLVEDEVRKCGFRFGSPGQVVHLMENVSSDFEFYLTDDACSYVLAFNHHDYLIGAGGVEDSMRTIGAD